LLYQQSTEKKSIGSYFVNLSSVIDQNYMMTFQGKQICETDGFRRCSNF